MTLVSPTPAPPAVPARTSLLRRLGGPRYAAVLAVDALGTGMLRPFLLLYGLTAVGLSPGGAGLAVTVGLLAGLAALPPAGRWLDRGARSTPVATTLLVRALGAALLVAAPTPAGFTIGALLLGLGSQAWPAAHAAVVATLATGRERDAALAAGRSLRNAALGVGALVATAAVGGGDTALRGLAAISALGYLASGIGAWGMRLRATAAPAAPSGGTRGELAYLRPLLVANLPYAANFSVLEVALPALLLTYLHASPAWSAGIFVGNTVLVITTQVALVVWLARVPRHRVLAGSGVLLAVAYVGFWGAGTLGGDAGPIAIALCAVVFTAGEILYAGSATALVIAGAPAGSLGRALSRFQLSTGIGMALAPALLTWLLTTGPGAMWGGLAAMTLLAAGSVVATSTRSTRLAG
ncbi:MFS transporter [Catellatospora aurea]|uniref:MFS transporter n=1 Tax=Catellatospora aurea TaxID=1337874 RepID=A0ABW2H6T5_9ACTN